jgi:hypothetical protein
LHTATSIEVNVCNTIEKESIVITYIYELFNRSNLIIKHSKTDVYTLQLYRIGPWSCLMCRKSFKVESFFLAWKLKLDSRKKVIQAQMSKVSSLIFELVLASTQNNGPCHKIISYHVKLGHREDRVLLSKSLS